MRRGITGNVRSLDLDILLIPDMYVQFDALRDISGVFAADRASSVFFDEPSGFFTFSVPSVLRSLRAALQSSHQNVHDSSIKHARAVFAFVL